MCGKGCRSTLAVSPGGGVPGRYGVGQDGCPGGGPGGNMVVVGQGRGPGRGPRGGVLVVEQGGGPGRGPGRVLCSVGRLPGEDRVRGAAGVWTQWRILDHRDGQIQILLERFARGREDTFRGKIQMIQK